VKKATKQRQLINVFIPAWMVPPMYHSLRRETIKVANSQIAMGVKCPTWFEDETVARVAAEGSTTRIEPMHDYDLSKKMLSLSKNSPNLKH